MNQNHLPQNSDFSSDFAYLFLRILENSKVFANIPKISLKNAISRGSSPRNFEPGDTPMVPTRTAVRAVHLHIQVANSLSTDSFIHAHRRFISRQGPVRTMRSDNGTNFIGAERELREEMEKMNHDAVQEPCCVEELIGVLIPQVPVSLVDCGSAKSDQSGRS